jgi:hypothetical protein
VPLIIMALWIGLYPKPFFQILEQPVNQIVQTIHDNSNPNAPANAQAAPAPSAQTAALAESNVIGSNVAAKVITPKVSAAKVSN